MHFYTGIDKVHVSKLMAEGQIYPSATVYIGGLFGWLRQIPLEEFQGVGRRNQMNLEIISLLFGLW